MADFKFPQMADSEIDWVKIDPHRPIRMKGHVQCTYKAHEGKWSAPQIVRSGTITMHGMASCLHYGQTCFEGLRAFRGPDHEIYAFRPKDNAKRMQDSARALAMPEVPTELFLESIRILLASSSEYVPPYASGASIYLRPFILATGPQFAPIPAHEYTYYLFAAPIFPHLGQELINALVVDKFDRCAPQGTGRFKIGGNYAPTMNYNVEAKEKGYNMTLYLDSLHHKDIDEFSGAAFIAVYPNEHGGRTLVVSDTPNVLKSFTADSIAELAKQAGFTVERRVIDAKELNKFTEVFAGGTASAILPCVSITRESTGEKWEYTKEKAMDGPWKETAYDQLFRMFKEYQHAEVPDVFDWRFKVTAKNKEEMMLDLKGMPNTQLIGKSS